MFGLFESSRTLGQPLDLYSFQVGGDVYNYCNGERDYSYAGMSYAATPIKHSAVTSSGTLDRATLTVTLADTLDLARRLRGYPSSTVIVLTIRQGHKDDPDAQVLVAWVGRVLGHQSDPETGTRALTCQPASTSLKRIGLRRKWQYGCPHVLYGDQCRADQARATIQTYITAAASTNAVALPAGWNAGRPIEKFAGGLFMWDSEVRTILAATATGATLGGPVVLSLGYSVRMALGCDHLRDDCRNLHVPRDEPEYGGGNVRNYGGQPFIPTTNPIGYVSNYT